MLIFGSRSGTAAVKFGGKHMCRNCERMKPFVIVLEYRYEHLYYLFGFVSSRKYHLLCETCGQGPEIDYREVEPTLDRLPIPFMPRFGCLVFFLLIVLIFTATNAPWWITAILVFVLVSIIIVANVPRRRSQEDPGILDAELDENEVSDTTHAPSDGVTTLTPAELERKTAEPTDAGNSKTVSALRTEHPELYGKLLEVNAHMQSLTGRLLSTYFVLLLIACCAIWFHWYKAIPALQNADLNYFYGYMAT